MRFKAAIALFAFTSISYSATEVSHTRYRDETARVEYSWIEDCTSFQLTVTAAKTKLKEDGATADAVPAVLVTFSTSTFCDLTNLEQTFWSTTAATADLQMDSNLRSARLTGNAIVRGLMVNGQQSTDLGTKPVAIDIVWSSDHPIEHYAGTIVTKYPGYVEVNHLTGHYRLASAFGTVFDGTKNLMPNAPQSAFVQLFRLNRGETILTKE